MKLAFYQVDAFTDRLFGGNPAGVCPLQEWLPDKLMQEIAMENNLSETAFFVKEKEGYRIRWFTPKVEVNLCGHATLASAHVLFNHLGFEQDLIEFSSRSGPLRIKMQDGLLSMDFPANLPVQVPVIHEIAEAFNITPIKCMKGREDLLLLYSKQEEIEALKPDIRKLSLLEYRAAIVTAPGKKVDFVSRFFAPRVGIDEDPVTGSAHTVLIPFWAERLGKEKMEALQLSKRGGRIYCHLNGDRVAIGGKAITYLKGEIEI